MAQRTFRPTRSAYRAALCLSLAIACIGCDGKGTARDAGPADAFVPTADAPIAPHTDAGADSGPAPGRDAGMLVEERLVDAPALTVRNLDWPSTPPLDCPFEPSTDLPGMVLLPRHAEYTSADTWYPSWAADGNMYSPFTDGDVNGVSSWSFGDNAQTGSATIVGDDPLSLSVGDPGVHRSSSLPYGGRYPCGTLVHHGVWYYGTYCLNSTVEGLNWDTMGPFVGFRVSTDLGKTWTETPHTPSNPLFGEPAQVNGKVKFGAPHFVDFGQNMGNSPDGKAYLVAHGAADPDPEPKLANLSWITGDQVYLARVTPSIDYINDVAQYEVFAGRDALGADVWSSSVADAAPIAAWNNNMGSVTMTYNAPLQKYLMVVTDGRNTVTRYNTYLLESDRITGPWKLVHYLHQFGRQGYFVNIPSKFISGDGRTLWLMYSANFAHQDDASWSDPPGSGYAMCVREVRLLDPGETPPSQPESPSVLDAVDNAARIATASSSSSYVGYGAAAAIDGVVDGYPGDIASEWASDGEREGAWLRLDWGKAQTIDRVWLFDRPNAYDQVIDGTLTFGDGSQIKFGALPDDASQGLEITFAARSTESLVITIGAKDSDFHNIGLSEVAAFRP